MRVIEVDVSAMLNIEESKGFDGRFFVKVKTDQAAVPVVIGIMAVAVFGQDQYVTKVVGFEVVIFASWIGCVKDHRAIIIALRCPAAYGYAVGFIFTVYDCSAGKIVEINSRRHYSHSFGYKTLPRERLSSSRRVNKTGQGNRPTTRCVTLRSRRKRRPYSH